MGITEPDFDKLAVDLWSKGGPKCTKVKEALRQVFEQGYQLGRETWAVGYKEGKYESRN